MDNLNSLQRETSTLLICSEENISKYNTHINGNSAWKLITPLKITDVKNDSYEVIFSHLPDAEYSDKLLSNYLSILKSNGKLILNDVSDVNKIEFELKIKGFVNVVLNGSTITSSKPSYKIGSASKLNFKKPVAAVWKLDDTEDDEIINPDNLLDAEDLKTPDPSTLRVCGTTGKRKACKDCSCGLAEELAEEQNSKTETTNLPKSSCGSCYLGDAFRCATCPYLGMPAFKPGEKIQLNDSQLKADI